MGLTLIFGAQNTLNGGQGMPCLEFFIIMGATAILCNLRGFSFVLTRSDYIYTITDIYARHSHEWCIIFGRKCK